MPSAIRRIFALSVALHLAASSGVIAADQGFDYPELMVTPRASDRLESEAKGEDDRIWITHLPIQVSATTTLVAGIIQLGNRDAGKDPDGYSALVGIGTGAGWLITTGLLAAFYRPYSSGSAELKALPRQSQRDQLARERAAEQAIESPARLARRLTWLSIGTNLAAGVYMTAMAKGNTLSVPADIAVMAFAFAPLLFSYRWQQIAHEQREYKKKIYAPISATGTLLPEPGTGRVAPGVALALRF